MTSIEWTEKTWNPVAGCTVLSPGCTNCYAMRMAARLQSMGVRKYEGLTRKSGKRAVWTGKVHCDEKTLQEPLKWRKPRMIFVNSMSDLFHEGVPFSFVERVWGIMEKAPQHTFQILTKRPEIMVDFTRIHLKKLPNVWLGTSVEDSDHLFRLDELRKVPAIIRFVSFEPLIGSVSGADLTDIHWTIVGGESGPKARPMELGWVEEIELSCRQNDSAFFFKQWGGTNKKVTGREFRGKTWSEFPLSVSA